MDDHECLVYPFRTEARAAEGQNPLTSRTRINLMSVTVRAKKTSFFVHVPSCDRCDYSHCFLRAEILCSPEIWLLKEKTHVSIYIYILKPSLCC